MNNQKEIDHKRLHLEDTLALVGEIEHMRHHNLRSSHATHNTDKEFGHLVSAATSQELRREVQATVGDISDEDWCELKVAQRIRQLNYETMEGNTKLFNELEDLVDSINSRILGQDMSNCHSCREDRGTTEL